MSMNEYLVAASGINKQGYKWLRFLGLTFEDLKHSQELKTGDFADCPQDYPLPAPGTMVVGQIQYAAKRRANPEYNADDPTSEQYIEVPGEARAKFIPQGYRPSPARAAKASGVAPEEDGF